MLISVGGTLVRTGVSEISVMGRNTQGVRLIRLAGNEKLAGAGRIEAMGGNNNHEDDGEEAISEESVSEAATTEED